MSGKSAIPCPEASDRAAQRAARHLQVLDELVELGLRLSYDICYQARGERMVAEAGLSFSRVSKAVRQSIALSARLTDGSLVADLHEADRRAELRAERANSNRIEVGRIIERHIEREAPESETERLRNELTERLDDEDDLLTDGDPDEIIARICSDLGLAAPPGSATFPRPSPSMAEAPEVNPPKPPDKPPSALNRSQRRYMAAMQRNPGARAHPPPRPSG